MPTNGSTLLSVLQSEFFATGNHIFTVSGQSVPVELINVTSATTYTSNTSLGNSTADERTLVVIYHSSLTVNAGVTVQPAARKRGMFLLVKGTATINGTITMTGFGSSAAGIPLSIWDSVVIPAVGGTGGARAGGSTTTSTTTAGIAGTTAPERGTGGGGSGGARRTGSTGTLTVQSGQGSDGTTWSGGSGGGGVHTFNNTFTTTQADAVGSVGGVATSRFASNPATSDVYIGGGAGIAPGNGGLVANGQTTLQTQGTPYRGGTGAGGLLMIAFLNKVTFGASGRLTSQGLAGGLGSTVSGGSSGSGSVQVLLRNPTGSTASSTIQTTHSVVTGIASTTPTGGATGIGGTGGAGSALTDSAADNGARSLFVKSGTLYRYNGLSWTSVSGTAPAVYQDNGMFDWEIVLIDKAKLAQLYTTTSELQSVNVKRHAP